MPPFTKSLIDGAASIEIAPGREGAPEAYHLASREILDVADAMIFVWDGMPARGIGGTEETVADARDRCVPIQIIDATSGVAGPFEMNRPFPWIDSSFVRLPVEDDLGALFKSLDLRALQGAPKSRLLAAGSITLNQVATLVSAILIAFFAGNEEAAPAVKFIIVCAAALLPWIGSRTRIRENWVEDRLHAELLRSLLASHSFAAPLRPFAAELFQSVAAFLRSAAWRLSIRNRPWDKERSRYINERLNDQIDYLEAKGNVAARRLDRMQTTFKISSCERLLLTELWEWCDSSGKRR